MSATGAAEEDSAERRGRRGTFRAVIEATDPAILARSAKENGEIEGTAFRSCRSLGRRARAGRSRKAYRPQTTAPNVFDEIHVTISDKHLSVSRHHGNRGDMGRFIILNTGKEPHTFTLGKSTHGTGQNAQGQGKAIRQPVGVHGHGQAQ